MAIEALPGDLLGTVVDFGNATRLFPGTPGVPFDSPDYGIATGGNALYYLPGIFFSVAGGGAAGGSAPIPSGASGTSTWDGGNK